MPGQVSTCAPPVQIPFDAAHVYKMARLASSHEELSVIPFSPAR